MSESHAHILRAQNFTRQIRVDARLSCLPLKIIRAACRVMSHRLVDKVIGTKWRVAGTEVRQLVNQLVSLAGSIAENVHRGLHASDFGRARIS